MIRTHSDDPDVAAAAREAATIVKHVLAQLPPAHDFDYGGHKLKLDEYGICTRCSGQIAEAQTAYRHLATAAEKIADSTVREHVGLAAEYFRLEAEEAEIRAELHSAKGTEPILNEILGFMYKRNVLDSYDHSHHGGK